MTLFLLSALAALLAASAGLEPPPRRSEAPAPLQLDLKAKVNVPVVLCIDDKATIGGQPSGDAYEKAAANGFRSILTLRIPKDGVDPMRDRLLVEKSRMRYFNIAPDTPLPNAKQVDEFLQITKDAANHPMLVNCAFTERVAPLMMIFRIQQEGWSEEKALDEAVRLGQARADLRKFARGYLNRPAKKK